MPSIYQKNCEYCNLSFTSTYRTARFCSKSHAAIVTNREKPKRLPEGRCVECDKPCCTSRKWCSDNCRSIAKQRRHKMSYERKKRANIEKVTRRRKELKRMAVEHMGGKCTACGYNRYVGAFTFHHIVSGKSFGICDGQSRSWDRIKEELTKCTLLCLNCHSETHSVQH